MSDNSTKRVLIIDDAALVRAYYRAALEAHGFAVGEALNGLEGLEKLLLEPFDLVIADINMPQMDGYTLARHLRQNTATGHTVLIAFTALDESVARPAGWRRVGV